MRELFNTTWLRCFAAGVCSSVGTWALNDNVIAVFSASFPLTRDIVFTAGSIVLYAALAYLARHRPTAIKPKAYSLAAVATAAVSTTLFLMPGVFSNEGLLAAAFFLCLAGRSWAAASFMLALCSLGNARSVAVCVGLFFAAGPLIQWLISFAPATVHLTALGLTTCLMILLTSRPSRALLADALANGRPEDLALSQPHSFVSPLSMAFFGILVLKLVFGFALALNCVSGVPLATFPTGLVAFCVAALAWFSKRKRGREDFLFQLAALLVVAGLLVAIVSLLSPLGPAANYILASGSVIFGILQDLVLVSMGMRNKAGALYVTAIGEAFSATGTLVGASSGHAVNFVMLSDATLAVVFIALMLFGFVVFCFVWLQKFSYDAIIHGIEPVKPLVVPAASETDQGLEERCAHLATNRGLTKRETEILCMLARGRNGKFIEEHFVVSYNTVKTHVKHIYTKLDVHSQQELIDLVESA